jgi:hypothetical protein
MTCPGFLLCTLGLKTCTTLADPMAVGDLIQDLTTQINPPRVLLLQRFNGEKLLQIRWLMGTFFRSDSIDPFSFPVLLPG